MIRPRRLAATTCLLLAVAGPAAADPSPDVVYPDDPQLQQAYEQGFGDGSVQGEDQGYQSGRGAGYDDGYAAGLSDGTQQGRDEAARQADESDLRDDVETEAEKSPTPTPSVVEGGENVDPTPAASFDDGSSGGGGFPWWPLAFAVVATVWFVTRRRRLDAEDDD